MEIEQVVAQVLRAYSKADKELERVLVGVLSKYDIEPKKNELTVVNGMWENELIMFLDRKRLAGCTDATIKQYSYCLNFALTVINKRTTDITEMDLYFFLQNYKKMNNVSDTTLLNYEKIFKSYFGWLHNKGVIRSNPAIGLDSIKCKKKVRRAFSDVEYEKIKSMCKSRRDIALVTLLYSSGMRIGECQKLDIDDIDFQNRRIIVYGKGRKEREVYLTDVAIMYLQAYLEERKDTSRALFVTSKSPHRRMEISGLQNVIRRLGKQCGVYSFPHKFRITMATNLSKKGMPLEEIKEILGHANVNTTMTYVNINKDRIYADYKRYA